MKKKDRDTEKKITMQVMTGWYMKFCHSKHYSKMKKPAQKNSERAILDLLCIMYYEFDTVPDEWFPEAMEKYCLFKLLDELYYERDEDYFRYVLEILLYFFNFLQDFKLQKNAEAILKVLQIHGPEIIEEYELRSEEDEEEYSDETLQEIIEDIEDMLPEFIKSKYFSELDNKYKDNCEGIILTFAQFMYEYTHLRPARWDTEGLSEICLDVMPRKVMADDEYFESVAPSLKAFFLFMDEKKINHKALDLAKEVDELSNKIVKASKKSSNWGVGKQILNQAVKKGVDLSDKIKLGGFLNSMMGKPLPLVGDEEETEAEIEYDNIVPFARKTPKVGRNDPCPCGSGKKYKKCCGK